MNYSKFSSNINKTLTGVDIRKSIYIFGHTIQETFDNTILIDNKDTYCKDISEAKRYIIQQLNADTIKQEIINEVYNNKPRIANIIKEEHGIKVTNNIIDQYIDLATSKSFTTDPVVFRLREMNQYDSIIENKTHYILEDGSCVAINNQTQKVINNLLENKTDVIEFMNKGSENFLNILAVLIKD